MKRLLLACGLLAMFACTKDVTENSGEAAGNEGAAIIGSIQYAAKGTVAVRLTPEAANAVMAAQLTRSTQTRSGIEGVDNILDNIGAYSMERIFSYDADWEELYAQTGMNCWYAVYFDEGEDLAKIGKLLAAQPQVAVVEYPIAPERRCRMSVGPARPLQPEDIISTPMTRASIPTNDTYLTSQWHYDNSGPGTGLAAKRKAGADVNLFDAWKICTGNENIIVAVLDEPIYTGHPDLKDNLWTSPTNPNEHGYNFYNKTDKLDWVTPEIKNGRYGYADHGSHVAGVIAAMNNNGRGVAGIAGGGGKGNGVKVMSCQILGNSNANRDAYADSKAFEYALKNGAVIAQNSWGYSIADNSTPADFEAIWKGSQYGDINALKTAMNTFILGAGKNTPNSPIQGGLIIFAAGNDGHIWGDAPMYPGADPSLIAVSAMDWGFLPSYFTDYGTWADITAPGGDELSGQAGLILSTILCDPSIAYKDGRKTTDAMFGYGWMQGTSMACPHVSGVAALGLAYAAQLGKKYTAAEYKSLLLSSAKNFDSYLVGTKRSPYGETLTMANYKQKMGSGSIDALKLLLAIKGTPAIYVKTGEAQTIDFSKYFGGAVLQNATGSDLAALGLSSLPAFVSGKLTITCTKVGTSFVTVKAKAGDTEISREFAIVSRDGLAENGGWM